MMVVEYNMIGNTKNQEFEKIFFLFEGNNEVDHIR